MSFIINWDSSWNEFMTKDNCLELSNIEEKLNNEGVFYPYRTNVLRFMSQNLKNIKCVIVGMDPYPSSYKINDKNYPIATGRSFEVANLSNWNQKFKQASLRNIVKTIYYNETNEKKSFDEIRELINKGIFDIKQPRNWFDSLEYQGVMFLNATLTVSPNKPDSHREYWDNYMNNVISYISSHTSNVKWFLWGEKAQNRVLPYIKKENAICTKHPRVNGFIDENCFGKIKEINWKG